MLKVIVPANQLGFVIYDQAAFNIYPHNFSDIRLHIFILHAGASADTINICQFTRRYALLIFRPIFRYPHKCQYISYVILCIFFKGIFAIIFINQYSVCISHRFYYMFRVLKRTFAALILMSLKICFPCVFFWFFHIYRFCYTANLSNISIIFSLSPLPFVLTLNSGISYSSII